MAHLPLDVPELIRGIAGGDVMFTVKIPEGNLEGILETAVPQLEHRRPRARELGGLRVVITEPGRDGHDAEHGRLRGMHEPVPGVADLRQGHDRRRPGVLQRREPGPFL